tara:strand:+ start:1606 stop:2091 length:486 start_codon:yes stop_codon:yes gene_type:complete
MLENNSITEEELDSARINWGNGIVDISKSYDEKGIESAISVANQILDILYGFEFGSVLFKPTLSGGKQTFRSDKEGTLSYFVGNNPKYPTDTGFGIKSWRKFESQTSILNIEDSIAMWMGWVTLTNKDGQSVKVDKSWCYKKTINGSIKIILHHSSLPYKA